MLYIIGRRTVGRRFRGGAICLSGKRTECVHDNRVFLEKILRIVGKEQDNTNEIFSIKDLGLFKMACVDLMYQLYPPYLPHKTPETQVSHV